MELFFSSQGLQKRIVIDWTLVTASAFSGRKVTRYNCRCGLTEFGFPRFGKLPTAWLGRPFDSM